MIRAPTKQSKYNRAFWSQAPEFFAELVEPVINPSVSGL